MDLVRSQAFHSFVLVWIQNLLLYCVLPFFRLKKLLLMSMFYVKQCLVMVILYSSSILPQNVWFLKFHARNIPAKIPLTWLSDFREDFKSFLPIASYVKLCLVMADILDLREVQKASYVWKGSTKLLLLRWLCLLWCPLRFPHKKCSVWIYLHLFVVGLMSYLSYMCLVEYSCVQHILCCAFAFVLSSSCVPYIASFSGLHCPFLIGPSVLSNFCYTRPMCWCRIYSAN